VCLKCMVTKIIGRRLCKIQRLDYRYE